MTARTRYWVASAEGCQVVDSLECSEARVSAWGGGRGAGGNGEAESLKMWQQAEIRPINREWGEDRTCQSLGSGLGVSCLRHREGKITGGEGRTDDWL